jgi:hypothetical protein
MSEMFCVDEEAQDRAWKRKVAMDDKKKKEKELNEEKLVE